MTGPIFTGVWQPPASDRRSPPTRAERVRDDTESIVRLRVFLIAILLVASACASLPPVKARPRWWAFTAPWDQRSDSSARLHAQQLDAVVYGWIPLDSSTGQPFDLDRKSVGEGKGGCRSG